jgi:hypothetical protein
MPQLGKNEPGPDAIIWTHPRRSSNFVGKNSLVDHDGGPPGLPETGINGLRLFPQSDLKRPWMKADMAHDPQALTGA